MMFSLFPKKESFEKTEEFIKAHPSLSYIEYIRLFLKKYGKKINKDNFPKLLVWMFEAIGEEER